MTTTPRRDPYGNPATPAPESSPPVKSSDESEEDKGTPMYVTDNPSVYGQPPKEPEEKKENK
jgi:hypothetical protein